MKLEDRMEQYNRENSNKLLESFVKEYASNEDGTIADKVEKYKNMPAKNMEL